MTVDKDINYTRAQIIAASIKAQLEREYRWLQGLGPVSAFERKGEIVSKKERDRRETLKELRRR